MKALSDLIAVILFFAIYLFSKNMVAATAVAVAVGVLQAAYTLYKHRRMSVMQWIGLITIVVFGGATILLNDRMFFMLKTTILTWLSALVMLASQLMGKTVWNRLGWAWAALFVALGAVNLAVAYPFSAEREALWVNFKVYGYLPLTIAFAIGQGIYLSRHLPKEES